MVGPALAIYLKQESPPKTTAGHSPRNDGHQGMAMNKANPTSNCWVIYIC